MKQFLPVILLCSPFLLPGQAVDSVAIKTVDSLIQVSRALTGQSDFDKALEVIAAAEKLALEKLGRESAGYGSCCFNRGRVFAIKGDYPEAEKWYIEAKAIQEKTLGKEHSDYAKSLNNLGNIYRNIGNYEQAEPLHLEAVAIFEKTFGKENPHYATSLDNLGNLYADMGQYEKAEMFNLKAKAIREKTLGKENSYYAASLVNLGVLYKEMGNYEKAEQFLLEAKEIFEVRLKDTEHPFYINCLNDLGNLYSNMGNYEKAELLNLEAVATREKVWGKEYPGYAENLINLANVYEYQGNYEKAEPLLLKAIAIQEKVLVKGKEGPDYAMSLISLATHYQNMGNYEKAEPLYFKAIVIREKVLGKDHPDYASGLNNLGFLYEAMGNYEKAEPLYLEDKAITEKVLGKDHPDYAVSLNNLGFLYMAMGNYEKAEPLYSELATLNRFLITKSLRHLSERELNSYLKKFSESQVQMLSFSQVTSRKKLGQTCFNNSLFYKGFLLSAANEVKRLALIDSITTEKFNLLKSYERRLAAEYSKPISERDSTNVASLETQANELEKNLTRTVAGYREAMRQVEWQEVQAALKKDEVAIEFVHFRINFPKKTDSVMYAALLLEPSTAQPQFIPLFEEKQLDRLLHTQGKRKADYVDNFYTLAGRSIEPESPGQKSLYELLWQPLEKELTGVKTIYFSPSGLLHRLNPGAIPLPQLSRGKTTEETLADKYRLVELGSTRQLVIPSDTKSGNAEAWLYGGIEYDMDSTAITAAISHLNTDVPANRGGLDFANADSTLRGGPWDYLKWTDVEVNAIEAILSGAGLHPTVRKGYDGTEESFKSIGRSFQGGRSPRILHLATHGFFFPDPKDNPHSAIRIPQSGEPVFKISDHPMIRSGLILAGGNCAWKTGKPFRPGAEDGILTAYEISQMNLSNTELVVLSACETGLGEIQGNEGVYGLQRAFKIAGAKYLIMSLWQVPDFQTQELMTSFYFLWLERKMPIPDAFRAAQKAMKEKYNSPFFWAGFVLVE